MAFNKDNFYKDGNSEEFFFDRTNPLANAANAEQLKIKECGACSLELVASISSPINTLDIVFAAPTDAYNTKYIKAQVTDKQGNFSSAVATGVVPNLSVDITNLNRYTVWVVDIVIATGEGDFLDCPCEVKYTFEYDNTIGTLDINTVDLKGGLLAIYEVGGTTPVTSVNLGSFPAGSGAIPFEVLVSNEKVGVLKIVSVTPAPDVLTATLPTYGDVLYQNDKVSLTGTVDGSFGAGLYSGTVTVVSDKNTVVLSVNYTLV